MWPDPDVNCYTLVVFLKVFSKGKKKQKEKKASEKTLCAKLFKRSLNLRKGIK